MNKGDLKEVEAVLISQATALNTIFAELARRAALNMGEYLDAADKYMRLALKAQGQCRSTLETLATVKNPPVVFAKRGQHCERAAAGEQRNAGYCARGKFNNRAKTNFWRHTMANGWTPERKARHAEAIRQWRPWEHSTGPRTIKGKAQAAHNA